MLIVPEKPLWGGNNKVCMYVCMYVYNYLKPSKDKG